MSDAADQIAVIDECGDDDREEIFVTDCIVEDEEVGKAVEHNEQADEIENHLESEDFQVVDDESYEPVLGDDQNLASEPLHSQQNAKFRPHEDVKTTVDSANAETAADMAYKPTACVLIEQPHTATKLVELEIAEQEDFCVVDEENDSEEEIRDKRVSEPENPEHNEILTDEPLASRDGATTPTLDEKEFMLDVPVSTANILPDTAGIITAESKPAEEATALNLSNQAEKSSLQITATITASEQPEPVVDDTDLLMETDAIVITDECEEETSPVLNENAKSASSLSATQAESVDNAGNREESAEEDKFMTVDEISDEPLTGVGEPVGEHSVHANLEDKFNEQQNVVTSDLENFPESTEDWLVLDDDSREWKASDKPEFRSAPKPPRTKVDSHGALKSGSRPLDKGHSKSTTSKRRPQPKQSPAGKPSAASGRAAAKRAKPEKDKTTVMNLDTVQPKATGTKRTIIPAVKSVVSHKRDDYISDKRSRALEKLRKRIADAKPADLTRKVGVTARPDHSSYKESVKRAVNVQRGTVNRSKPNLAPSSQKTRISRSEKVVKKGHSTGSTKPGDKGRHHHHHCESTEKRSDRKGSSHTRKHGDPAGKPDSKKSAAAASAVGSVFPVFPGSKTDSQPKSSQNEPNEASHKDKPLEKVKKQSNASKAAPPAKIESESSNIEPEPVAPSDPESKEPATPAESVKKPNVSVLGWVNSLYDLEYPVKKYTSFFCIPCREMLATTAIWEEHLSLSQHRQNVIVWRETQGMSGSGAAKIFADSDAKTQDLIDKIRGVVTGADYVVEVQDPKSKAVEQWVCLLCHYLCETKDKLISHVISSSHIVTHILSLHPGLITPPFSKALTCQQLLGADSTSMVKIKVQEHCQTFGRGKMKCCIGRRFEVLNEALQDQLDVEDTVLKTQMESLFESEVEFIPKFRLLGQTDSVANSYIDSAPEATSNPSLIVGLQYIVEFWTPSRLCKPIYYCILCDYITFDVLAHCAAMKHTIGYFAKHYRSVYDVIINEDGIKSCTDVRRGFEVAKGKIMAIEGWKGAVSFVIELFQGNDVFVPINAAIARAIIKRLNLVVPDPPKKQHSVLRPVPPPSKPPPMHVNVNYAKSVVAKAKKPKRRLQPSKMKPEPIKPPTLPEHHGRGLKRASRSSHSSATKSSADRPARTGSTREFPSTPKLPMLRSRTRRVRSPLRPAPPRHPSDHSTPRSVIILSESKPKGANVRQNCSSDRRRSTPRRNRSPDYPAKRQKMEHSRQIVPLLDNPPEGFDGRERSERDFKRRSRVEKYVEQPSIHEDHSCRKFLDQPPSSADYYNNVRGPPSPKSRMRVEVGHAKEPREVTLFSSSPLDSSRNNRNPPSRSGRRRHHSGDLRSEPRRHHNPEFRHREHREKTRSRSRSPHGARYVSEVLNSATAKGRGNRAERSLSAHDLSQLQVALEAVNVTLGRPITMSDLSMLRLRLGDSMVDKLLDQVCSAGKKFPIFPPSSSPAQVPSPFTVSKQPFVVPPPASSMSRYPAPVRIASGVTEPQRSTVLPSGIPYGHVNGSVPTYAALAPVVSVRSHVFPVPPPVLSASPVLSPYLGYPLSVPVSQAPPGSVFVTHKGVPPPTTAPQWPGSVLHRGSYERDRR